MKFKKTIQTLSYLPYFVSWIVVVTLMRRLLTPYGGPVNDLLGSFGVESIQFLNNPTWFYQMIVGSDIWKNIGWNSIIFMAAIAGIDQRLYEAAKIDGAGRFKQMWHVTLPGIRNVAIILFILAVGNLMSAGYEQLLLLNGPATASMGACWTCTPSIPVSGKGVSVTPRSRAIPKHYRAHPGSDRQSHRPQSQ